MSFNRFYFGIGGSAILFALGLAFGQRQIPVYFGKYLRPAPITRMDFLILEANINLLRSYTQWSDDMGTPEILYFAGQSQIRAQVMVASHFRELSVEAAREKIELKGASAYAELTRRMPDLKYEDFTLEVYEITGHGKELFAVYRLPDKLVFR